MKKTIQLLIISIAATFTSALAAEEQEYDFLNGNFTSWMELATDRVFRSESETQNTEIPSFQGLITWTHSSGFYAGFWAATNKFDLAPDIYAEAGPYIGMAGDIGSTGFKYNVFIWHYIYFENGPNHYDYTELWMNLSRQFGPVNVNLEITPTLNDWFNIEGVSGVNYALTGTYSFGSGWSGSATLGYQDLNKIIEPWMHWNLGVSKTLGKGWKADLRYHDTDLAEEDDPTEIFQERVVVGISRSF